MSGGAGGGVRKRAGFFGFQLFSRSVALRGLINGSRWVKANKNPK
jgi:hypothetical protein